MEKLCDFFMASPQATRSQIKVGKREEDFKIHMRFKFGFRRSSLFCMRLNLNNIILFLNRILLEVMDSS